MARVAIIGTFDTKGMENLYIKDILEKEGLSVMMIHAGVFPADFDVDVSNEMIALAGGEKLSDIVRKNDRGHAMEVLSKGLVRLIPKLYEKELFEGVISLGGSGGTALVTPAMRELPIGVPKIMVTTLASSDVRRYVGTSDIIMIPSVVDVAGINYISSKVFSNAAHALAGMIHQRDLSVLYGDCNKSSQQKPLIAATMYGVTTPCVMKAKERLEELGFEVLVFHASGIGGQSMENLIRSGVVQGVLDITTTEWTDELMGGIMAAGQGRNEAACLMGIPQVVSVGAMDIVTFGAMDSVPARYKDRNLRMHNPQITIMRTTVEENQLLGKKLAEKLNMAKEKTDLLLPLKGVSMVDAKDMPFYGPEEDQALFNALKDNIHNENVNIIEIDAHINDEEFALEAAERLVELMNK